MKSMHPVGFAFSVWLTCTAEPFAFWMGIDKPTHTRWNHCVGQDLLSATCKILETFRALVILEEREGEEVRRRWE